MFVPINYIIRDGNYIIRDGNIVHFYPLLGIP